MTAEELKRIKDIAARSETLTSEISQLTKEVEASKKVKAIKFTFTPWRIEFEDSDNEKLQNVYSMRLLEDHAEEFRTAFIAIVQKVIDQKQAEFSELKV